MKRQTKTVDSARLLTETLPLYQNQRKKVGILGGTFNPVHHAHLLVADQVYHQLALDHIYLMPSYLPPHVDHKETIASSDRLAMLQLAVEANPCLAIETCELERQGKSYTYDTIKWLKEQHPDTDYFFIIGGDMVEYLPKWYKIDELVEMVQFVGIRRPNYSHQTDYSVIWLDVPELDISSSMIRKKVQEGCSIRYLLPENVIDYIYKKGLYLDGK